MVYLESFSPQITTNICQLACERENTQVEHELQRKPCISLTILNLDEDDKLVKFASVHNS